MRRARRLRSRDPITALSDDGKFVKLVVEEAVRGRIDALYATGVYKGVPRSFMRYPLHVRDEHVTWVRGHVSEHDEAGAALLASAAMLI